MVFGSNICAALPIEAGSEQFAPNRRYVLARVNLVRGIGSPPEVLSWRQNQADSVPIVIEKNRPLHPGSMPIGVFHGNVSPSRIIVAGARTRRALLEKGVIHAWVWAEEGSVPEQDTIRPAEYLSMVQAALEKTAFQGRDRPYPGQPWPVLVGVFPLQEKLRYQAGDHVATSRYTLYEDEYGTPRMRLRLNAGTGYATLPSGREAKPKKLDDEAKAKLWPVWGAEKSELMLRISNTWERQQKAVDAYLNAIKKGTYVPLTPSFAPVPIAYGRFGTRLQAAIGTSLFDFARWTAREMDREKQTTVDPSASVLHAVAASLS